MPKLWQRSGYLPSYPVLQEGGKCWSTQLYTINLLDSWLKKVGTDNSMRQSLVKYARMRGGGSMVYVARGKGARFEKLAQSMDSIGWRRYMEGMVSAEILEIQSDFVDFGRCTLSLDIWAKGLMMKLLEITHGQWLYRNV